MKNKTTEQNDERAKEFLSCLGNGWGSEDVAYSQETQEEEE